MKEKLLEGLSMMKILSVVLSLAMVIALIPMNCISVYAADIIITVVDISGIDAPVTGEPLDTEGVCTTTGISTTTPAVTWKVGDVEKTGTAEALTTYTVYVTLGIESGYRISSASGSLINGNVATITEKTATYAVISYTFPATEAGGPKEITSGENTINSSGDYILNEDVNGHIVITNNAVVTIDFNGHVLTSDSSSSVVTVNSGSQLTINDSNPTAEHKYVVGSDSIWSLNDTAEGGTMLGDIEAIPTENDVIIIPGGAIIGGNKTSGNGEGAGIYNAGTIIMNGVGIIGNKSSGGNCYGGGVLNSGTFTMNDGVIAGNTGGTGGGVINRNIFNMTGGKIIGNFAGMGGGVNNDKYFTITGGEITYNVGGYGSGGGIRSVWPNDAKVTVGGTAKIMGNTHDGIANNVLLGDSHTITVQSGFAGSVGVSKNPNYPTISAPNDSDYSAYFKSDNGNYYIYNMLPANVIQLLQCKHSWGYSVSGNMLIAKCKGNTNGCSFATCDRNTDEAAVKLTITASSPNFSGNAATITMGTTDEKTIWTGAGLTIPTSISYEKSDGTLLEAAPTTVGNYVAKVSPYGETADESNTAKVSYTISKAEPSATAPTANTLTYNGSDQALVNEGSTSHGTLQYALSSNVIFTDSIPTGGNFSTSIPTAKNAGTYYVYYKVVGDSEHSDKIFEEPVSVTISKATYEGTKTVSGNVLAGYASSNEGVELPEIPDNMVYGTPSYSSPITSATITNNAGAGNKVIKYSADNSAVAGTVYDITIPVTEETGKSANFNNYNITLTVTAFTCEHTSTTPVSKVDETCTEDGTKAHAVCSVCGSKLINGEVKTDDELKIDKKGHDFKIKSSGNVMTIYCSRCIEARSVTVNATSPKEAGKASEITIGTEAEKASWEEIGYSVSDNRIEHYRGNVKLNAAPTTEGRYTAKVTVSTNALAATAEVKYSIGDVTKYATDYDVIYTKPIDANKAKKGVTIESSDGNIPDGIITVNSKLKITMLDSQWTAKAYTQQRVTPENVESVKWDDNSKTLKKFASVKYNKNKNKTLIKTKQNKKIPGGVYAVKLEDGKGNTIYLNIECIELNKAIRRNCIYTKSGSAAVSANDILFEEDGENVKTVALTMLGSDNKTNSEFNNNGVRWKAGLGKKAVSIEEDKVTEYKDKKGSVIGYLTLDDDGTVKILAGTAKGKINLTAMVNGKTYKTAVVVKEKK